jgi:uncharacterized protein (DUF362 family)
MQYKSDMSRRDFVKVTGLALGAGALLGSESIARELSTTAQGLTAVGIARGETIGRAVRKAVELSGGMNFIKSGQTVLIKPNVNSGDAYPASTNPEVIYEVIKMVWERDPKRVIVGERSNYLRTTRDEMKKAGIDKAIFDGKAELVTFDDMSWRFVNPTKSVNWDTGYHVAEMLYQVDHIINVPVIKTHNTGWFTMSMKNLVGIIPGKDRIYMHSKVPANLRDSVKEQTPQNYNYPAFAKMIAEIGLAVTPSLNILDGTKAFVKGGPREGDSVQPKLIVASRDRIAADVTGLGVLKHYGTTDRIQKVSVWQQLVIARAVEIGLGVSDLSQIDLKSANIPEIESIRTQMI